MTRAVQPDDLAAAVAILRHSRFTTALTGAGISTPSGIPDFRSPDSGLWNDVDVWAVASIQGFQQNPSAFYRWLHPLAQTLLLAQPNPAHDALARLENLGRLQTVITQNIDGLHTQAGSQAVYELHGHAREATCQQCGRVLAARPLMEQFLNDGQVPRCPICGGVVKPNVILFGELLPAVVMQQAQAATEQAEVMLVVGSSLEVAPANELPLLTVHRGGKLILINYQPTHLDRYADLLLRGDAAELLPQIVQHLENLA